LKNFFKKTIDKPVSVCYTITIKGRKRKPCTKVIR
jgi:hypothetical protein